MKTGMMAGMVLALALATPVAATQYLVTIGGVLQQTPTNPPGTTRLDLPMFSGSPYLMQMVLDGTSAGTVVAAPGGVGEARSYFAASLGFYLAGSGFEFVSAAGGASQIFVLNDVGTPANPSARNDQVTFNAATTFSGGAAIPGFNLSVAPDLGAPADLYVSSFAFGRVVSGTVNALPMLINSVEFPALEQVWGTGPFLFNLQFRAGSPTSGPEQSALPLAVFTSAPQFVQIELLSSVVPEPATWGMMILGFGLVGVAIRRRGERSTAAI